MNNAILLHSNSKDFVATVHLGGSKSISNRVLLIRALCEDTFDIENLSDSDDTLAMNKLLNQSDGLYDAGHAGTTFRFMTAYLGFKQGTQRLTGSERMKQRPIKALVDALRDIGANIEYEKIDGYPPLIIHAPNTNLKKKVSVKADISSQYLSALLMLAPTLENGLTLELEGDIVSRPYLMMTLSIMKDFGVEYVWKENTIHIPPQKYKAKKYFVEADWSSASYLYSWVALADEAKLKVYGLFENSIQGDSAIKDIAKNFGVITTKYDDGTLEISKTKEAVCSPFIEYDFIEQPDIAQTVFAMCAGKNVKGLFTGLQTLYIKETDRIKAFQNELSKVGCYLTKVPKKFQSKDSREFFMLDGEISIGEAPVFETYHDHRMAMALAPLSKINDVIINESDVVSKSYPNYWTDVEKFNVSIKKL